MPGQRLWIAPVRSRLWAGNLWTCQNAETEDKADWLITSKWLQVLVVKQAWHCTVTCSSQVYETFQYNGVETSSKASMEFISRVQLCALNADFFESRSKNKSYELAQWIIVVKICHNFLWSFLLVCLSDRSSKFLRPHSFPVCGVWDSEVLFPNVVSCCSWHGNCLISCREVVLLVRSMQMWFFRGWVWYDCCLYIRQGGRRPAEAKDWWGKAVLTQEFMGWAGIEWA